MLDFMEIGGTIGPICSSLAGSTVVEREHITDSEELSLLATYMYPPPLYRRLLALLRVKRIRMDEYVYVAKDGDGLYRYSSATQKFERVITGNITRKVSYRRPKGA